MSNIAVGETKSIVVCEKTVQIYNELLLRCRIKMHNIKLDWLFKRNGK